LIPQQDNGGFFLAAKYGGIALPEGVEAQYHDDEGSFATSIEAAILAMRSAWVENRAGMEMRLDGYKEGARKRTQMLLLINDPGNGVLGPVKLTTIGTANEELPIAYNALKSIARTQGAEPWMFWVMLSAGQTQTVGDHNVTMTPIEVSAPDADGLVQAYVGNDVVECITAIADDVAGWAAAWEGGDYIGGDVFDDENAQAVEGVASLPPELRGALDAMVTTQKYGKTTFADLVQRDVAYAVRVANHVLKNSAGFKENTVRAARAVLDIGSEAGEEESEEIPF
jgi:hypothetical protein